MLPATSYEAARNTNWAWWRVTAFYTLVAALVIGCCAVGSIFGWVRYFEDDGFAPQFALANEQNEALQQAIDNERTSRQEADAVLTSEQAATRAALNAEIATRTAEDAFLLALVNAEIAARTAAQAQLSASINTEIATRTAFDQMAFAQVANLTARLALLTAYDIYAQSLFVGIYNNLTLLEIELANEIAARNASEAVLFAQDIAQQAFIAMFASELAAEIATRTSEGEMQQAQINAFLGDGILTLNNQSSLNHNFQFVSANAGFTIGSGGSNVITITDNAIRTVDSVTPAPGTEDISILADGNVVLTPGTNSLNFGLAIIPPLPNYAQYHGTWAAAGAGTCAVTTRAGLWQFDANGIPSCSAVSPFITNYNTPPPYAGTGWEVPTSGGVGYGTWLVRVVMALTVQYQSTPIGVAFTMGLCVNTRANCIANPSNNEGEASLVWQRFEVVLSGPWTDSGLNYQDHFFKTSYVLDGRGLAAGTGVFPVWSNAQGQQLFVANAFLNAIMVEYDVAQLA